MTKKKQDVEQEEIKHVEVEKPTLPEFAEDLGFDTQTFNECLDSGKYTSLIQEDTSTSGALGVKSTPTFLVNGQAIVGAQPFEAFQQIIDPLLK